MLCSHLSTLLTLAIIRVDGQVSGEVVELTSRASRGDHISPLMFDLIMDTFLERLSAGDTGIASCLADDAMLMARTRSGLQKMLNR